MKKPAALLFLFLFLLSSAYSQADTTKPVQALFQPLQVKAFNVQVNNRNVQLLWTVSGNEDARNFDIERADEGGDYKKIGSRLGTGKAGDAAYEFVDALPKKGIVLSYRVRIVGKDGSSLYSELQSTRIDEAAWQCRLRQNPVRHVIEIEIQTPGAGNLQASVFTNYGQKVTAETVKLRAGANVFSLPSDNLQPGLHRLVLETGTERKVISFVKE